MQPNDAGKQSTGVGGSVLDGHVGQAVAFHQKIDGLPIDHFQVFLFELLVVIVKTSIDQLLSGVVSGYTRGRYDNTCK